MFKELRLNVSLVFGITCLSLGFAVQRTSQCWNSQFGGAETFNSHVVVSSGVYLDPSSDSGTVFNQSCVICDEMANLNDEQKRHLKKLYKLGRKVVHTNSHIDYLEKCLEQNIIPKSFKFSSQKFKVPGNPKVIQKHLDNVSFEAIRVEKERHVNIYKSAKKDLDKVKSKLVEVFDEEAVKKTNMKLIKHREKIRIEKLVVKQRKVLRDVTLAADDDDVF